jgi:hypothetical protein
MSTLIIESNNAKLKDTTSIVHVRNSIILANELGADVCSTIDEIPETLTKQYDNIICMYASPYMPYQELSQILINNPNARLWWLVNDHDVEDNILLRNELKRTDGKRTYGMICNNPRDGYRGWILRKKILDKTLNDFIDEWHTLNLNTLIFPSDGKVTVPDNTDIFGNNDNIIYWGTYRKHRLPYFKKYSHMSISFSCSTKNKTKLINEGCVYSYRDRIQWQSDDISNYKYSLYLEDIHTHDNFAFMANRFYEGLMYGLVTFFDESCRNSIVKSNYPISDYFIVNSVADIHNKIKKRSYYDMINEQRLAIPTILTERKTVIQTIKNILGDSYENV